MSSATTLPESTDPLVVVRREGAITRITLNRPRALNALTRDMFAMVGEAVAAAQTDGSQAILLDGAGDRGFCGGGDIKQLSGEQGPEILALEYRVDHAVATSQIPVVGFMDGITMGGGIGLTGHAHHRVVTERSRLAMPEARIGIAPDVGGHRLLARAPHRLGEYLAMTSAEMGPLDAIALNFADVLVPSRELDALREALAAGEDPEAAIARFADPNAPDQVTEAPMLAVGAWWGPIAEEALGDDWRAVFARPAEAALRLVAALEQAAEVEATDGLGDAARIAGATAADEAEARAAGRTAATIREMCPTSVAVTLAQIARTRAFDFTLAEVLVDDLRVLGRLAPRPDFTEGVRAQVIDKDRNPVWQPETLELLDEAELGAILDPRLGPDERALEL
ncbi:enoyl-CoA hydratase/isomerase family protein [Leucobacter salsicius]|uniref:enoyl-CoA hydratase/isomerase family protein n=1 Tax=Leucobacter salsicius TaxID=664638 RepID=UPI00034CDC0F|nr:enoyl-CoA hydratase/isomerase family protein [Leucobacter salsicius]